MQIHSAFLAEIDSVCDYIPVVSSATNLVDLFLKSVCKCFSKDSIKDRFWTYIQNKSMYRSLALLLPILGNIYIFFEDMQVYFSDKAYFQKNSSGNSESFFRESQAFFLSRISGLPLASESLKIAGKEEEREMWAAACMSDVEWMKELLAKQINPNFFDSGHTPLTIACFQSPEIASLLMEHGADINLKDRFGTSPLMAACISGNQELVKLLLKRGADVNACNALGETPFMLAAEQGNLNIVKLLHPHVKEIDLAGQKGQTPLMKASFRGHLEIVDFLLNHGADPKKKTVDGGDSLSIAIFMKQEKVIEKLMLSDSCLDDHLYEISIPYFFIGRYCIKNLTPFLFATLLGNAECALKIIEKSNVTKVSSVGKTSLHFSVKQIDVLKAILQKNATLAFINKQDLLKSTALHEATCLKEETAALLLLEKGADPFLVNEQGKTPLLLAAEHGQKEVIEVIRKKFPGKITPALQKQVDELLIQASLKPKEEKTEEKSLFASAFDLTISSLETIQNFRSTRAESMQKKHRYGPVPLSGMEILFGKLPFPEFV